MAASSRSARDAKRRVQQMEAKRELRKEQDKRRKRDNILAVGAGTAALALALVLQLTVFSANPSEDEYAAAQAGLTTPPAPDPATPSPSPSNADNIPKPETAAGQTFTGELQLNSGTLGVELDGTKAPQAAAVFKSLTDQNFYAGLNCHRLTTGEMFGVLQCGSKSGDGSSDPSYAWGPLENTPADNMYPAGTIAVARSGSAYSNGTQFFIVYKDTVIPADAAGGYSVVGKVTSGLDVVSQIAAAGLKPGDNATDGAPVEPVTIDSFSLK